MKREVKFSLVFRDMWQSAGKYVPRVDQLVKVAPAIIEMGCFARVETNGGGFEQVNLLSVSYTHLDVYKRQRSHVWQQGCFRHSYIFGAAHLFGQCFEIFIAGDHLIYLLY